MTRIVAVAVQYTSARIGLHQQAICQTSFAEHPAVRLTFLVRTDVATRHIRIDTVAVLPPGSDALLPVAGLKLEDANGARHTPSPSGRFARCVNQ